MHMPTASKTHFMLFIILFSTIHAPIKAQVPQIDESCLNSATCLPQAITCKIIYQPTRFGKLPFHVEHNEFIEFYDQYAKLIKRAIYNRGHIVYDLRPKVASVRQIPISAIDDIDLTLAQDSIASQMFRTEFKHQLYRVYGASLDEDNFMWLIEPFIEHAEKNLVCYEFSMQNPNSPLCQKYVDSLKWYINASFHEYISSNKDTRRARDAAQEGLLGIIIDIKNNNDYCDLNILQEWHKTKNLFTQFNKEYYKSLPKRKKIGLFFSKFTDN